MIIKVYVGFNDNGNDIFNDNDNVNDNHYMNLDFICL